MRTKTTRQDLKMHTGAIVALAILGGAGVAASLMSGAAGASTHHSTKSVVISVAKNAKLGSILVSGKTLYTLNKTDCTAQCLKVWPAVTLPNGVTKATAGKGITASKLGTVKMSNGSLQVTYGGKRLYFFVEDAASGQVHGNNVKDQWGTWSAYVTVKPSSSSGGSTSSSGGSTVTTAPSGGTSAPASPTSTSSPSTPTAPTTTTAPKPTTTTTPPSGGTAF